MEGVKQSEVKGEELQVDMFTLSLITIQSQIQIYSTVTNRLRFAKNVQYGQRGTGRVYASVHHFCRGAPYAFLNKMCRG